MMAICKYLLLPSGLIFICATSGLILLSARKARRVGVSLLAAAAALYLIFASGPISSWLLGSLELKYPPLISNKPVENVDTILILTGYARSDPALPISSQVNSASAFRIMEGLALSEALPEAEILISGGGEIPSVMKRVLVSLGAPADKISIEDKSINTYKSAVNVQEKLGHRPFVLVTSAGHMVRASSVFRKLGMNPVPAPTNHLAHQDISGMNYLPSPFNLRNSDLAVYEYLGILWYYLQDRL